MSHATPNGPISPGISKGRLWTGRVMSVVPGLMMLLDGVMKIVKPEEVVKQTMKLGYPENVIIPLGIAVAISAVLYLIPRTSMFGLILLTGYLGGAVDAHVHAGQVVQIAFPVIFAALLWGGMCLRYPQVSAAVFGSKPI